MGLGAIGVRHSAESPLTIAGCGFLVSDETYDGIEVMHLIPILHRIEENLPRTVTKDGLKVCGSCGCLLAPIDRRCPNCEYQLLKEGEDG